ncbi:MAG: DEAD/DEAH box helicase family protein [Acidobacteriota bacterium]|nr:DEAD/DEAH box helicase family protein [Acidobacteriota bacterium]
MAKAKQAKTKLRFNQRLVLNQFFLQKIFGVESFDRLTEGLKDGELELLDADNITRLHHVIKARFANDARLRAEDLLRYDGNIVRYTLELNRHRRQPVRWRYFQYLSLLFTEIYLDLWATDETELLKRLNWFVRDFNAAHPGDALGDFTPADLRKVAFWNATGSGKTLLLHVNLQQIQHYWHKRFPTKKFDQIILLTPNEGLSRQHLEELRESGIEAEIFDRNARHFYSDGTVRLIAIHKLRKDAGKETVSVDSFEGTNLVFVDEGHRGASGEEWKSIREQLAETGFAFEYSATFGQAVKASKKDDLAEEYAKAILFDYSYKYFHADGYGKDYRILNLPEANTTDPRHEYLTACLLTFYQQLRFFDERKETLKPFEVARPLWVFVGASVTKTTSEKDLTDVVDILLFLARFIREGRESIGIIERLLVGRANLLDDSGRNLFSNSFDSLVESGLSAEQVFADVLSRLFNAPASALLRIENLAKISGEIALSVGENDPFGVINVGEDAKLIKLCERHKEALNVKQRDFAKSLFESVNDPVSTINLVIGSRKFSEGWNSWRVSTMGLMNIGKTEGSQIIQLFGRGVRLKGYNFGLKRSRRLEDKSVVVPKNIELVETLNVFGLRADYMAQFKEYLEEEGLPTVSTIEFVLPVVTLDYWQKKRLKMIRVRTGGEFVRKPATLSAEVPPKLQGKTKLDAYPKLEAMTSSTLKVDDGNKQSAIFEPHHLAFLDLNKIYLDLQAFKAERGWHNFSLSKNEIEELLGRKDWYQLLMPGAELNLPMSFQNSRRWQETITSLLKKYCESFYKLKKEEHEKKEYEYYDLQPEDSKNFIDAYRLTVEASQSAIVEKLEELKRLIESRELLLNGEWQYSNLTAIGFNKHLYLPLLAVDSKMGIKISPVALDTSEKDFVRDLQKYCEQHTDYFRLGERELYLLRNQSRGKGVGFFEAGNFYPDFILWILRPDKQFVSFIDPKGIRNLNSIDDPKIRFRQTIKDLERSLQESAPEVVLNSFIVSNTAQYEVPWGRSLGLADFEQNHVFFQYEDRLNYIEKMLKVIEQ